MPPLAKRLILLLLVGASLAALGAAGRIALQPEYTVLVDGRTVAVRGDYATVAGVLTAAGVTVSSSDLVAPGPAEAADPAVAVQIVRARRVEVTADGASQLHYTQQPTLGAFLSEIGLVVGRTDRVLADGRPLSLANLFNSPLPQRLTVNRQLTVTIVDGDRRSVHTTVAATVGEALREAGVTLVAADGVEPGLGSWLTPDLLITVRRSRPYTILVDGRSVQTRSHADDVLSVLAEAGIGLVGRDYTRPSAETPLTAGAVIEVVRMVEEYAIRDTPIPFARRWQPSDQLEIDTTGILVPGRDGIHRERWRITTENGVEIERVLESAWTAAEPVTQIQGYGTQIVVRTLETPDGPISYWRKVRMRVTSYTAATSGKAPGEPGYGVTASGASAGYGIVAVDRSIVPFRTYVYVPGYGIGFAGDTGGGVVGRWIDLGYDVGAFRSWRGYVDVYYLPPVPEPERINYLLPTWLP